MVRTWALEVVAIGILMLGGCPRDTKVPPIGESAEPCAHLVDCNTAICGLLRACVDGYCEQGTSLVIPCLD